MISIWIGLSFYASRVNHLCQGSVTDTAITILPLFWGNFPHFRGSDRGGEFGNFSPFFGDFPPRWLWKELTSLARSSPTLVPQSYLSLGPVLGSGYWRDRGWYSRELRASQTTAAIPPSGPPKRPYRSKGALERNWEKLNRGVSKPGCFPLFSGKVQIVSRTLSGLFLVGALNRPRKRKRTNRENPRTIPEQIGKIPGKGQKRKDKSRSGNPPVWNTPVKRFSGPWKEGMSYFIRVSSGHCAWKELSEGTRNAHELFLHKLFEHRQGSGTSRQNSRDIGHHHFERKTPNPTGWSLDRKNGRLIFYHYWCWRAGGTAPVKTSTGNSFPRKYQRNSHKSLPVLVLNFGYVFAFQYWYW